MWGLSPALDLLEELQWAGGGPAEGRSVQVLLLGSVDGRHVLKTMAGGRGPAVYHVLDLATELVARQALLLMLALEPPDRLGLREKARAWMELYGNTLLRPSTARYLINKSVQMVHLVTNKSFLERRMPCLNFDELRYKEKDHLENIFKYWITNRGSIAKIWDQNLRRYLGTRYDAKMGVFDWDYNMKLLEIEDGKRVCYPEYKNWRNTGVAYTWLETEACVANPTLAVGIGVYGDQLFSRGYLGDMESGPYFGFGTSCGEDAMLETRGGHSLWRATDITERHLQRIFHQIQTGSLPTDQFSSDLEMGLVQTQLPALSLEDETPLEFQPERAREEYSALPVPGHSVVFLPSNFLQVHVFKEKYQGFFDIVYVAQNYFKFFGEGLLRVLKPDCPVIIETRKFVIALHKKIPEFGKEVREKMEALGGKEIYKSDFTKDSHVLFRVNVELIKQGSESNVEDNEKVSKVSLHATIPEELKASNNPLENQLPEDTIEYN